MAIFGLISAMTRAQVPVLQLAGDGHELPQVLAPEFQLAGLLPHVGDLAQPHGGPCAGLIRMSLQPLDPVHGFGSSHHADVGDAVGLQDVGRHLAELRRA